MLRKEFVPYSIFDPITDLKIKVHKLCGVNLGDKILKKALSLNMTPQEVADEVISFQQLLESAGLSHTFNDYIQ